MHREFHSNREFHFEMSSIPGLLALIGVSLAFLLLAVQAHAGESAHDIMVKNEEARKIDDVNSDATITTGGGSAGEKSKDFTWWRKLTSDKVHFNTLTRFHQPAEVRGEGILFLEHDNDQNDVQIYLPAFKKIRRVESQQQSGSFMGSEFSYADIAAPHVEDYKYELQKDDDCLIDGSAKSRCYVIDATPSNDDVKVRTGYSKTRQWLRKDNFMMVKGEFSDIQGLPWKTMEASEIKEVDSNHHKWMALKIRIENTKSHRFTLLDFKKVKVNQGIQDAIFSNQNLAREK